MMHQSTTDTCVGSARCKDIRSELCIPVQVRSFVSRFLKLRLTYTGTADALHDGSCLRVGEWQSLQSIDGDQTGAEVGGRRCRNLKKATPLCAK